MTRIESFPFIIGWELTLACNLACRHCGSSAGTPRHDELTLKEALGLADQFQDLLVQEVHFTGGEPLLHPGWEALAGLLTESGIAVRMVTNGLLLTREVAARMTAAGITAIAVSVDGPEHIHDGVRGMRGAWRAAIAAIEHARNAGLRVSAITTVHAGNIEHLDALAKIVREAGVVNWQVQPLFPFGRSCRNGALRLSDQSFLELGTLVAEHQAPLAAAGISLSPADSFGYYTACDTRMPEWRGCPAGLFSCGITSDGRVKACLSLPDELAEGDLRQTDLWTEWFRQDAFSFNRNNGVDALGPSCSGCEIAAQCRGGCSAMSYACTGSFHNDPYCFLRLQRSREARRRVPASAATGETSGPATQTTRASRHEEGDTRKAGMFPPGGRRSSS